MISNYVMGALAWKLITISQKRVIFIFQYRITYIMFNIGLTSVIPILLSKYALESKDSQTDKR
jgi:hypothetical protein